MRTIPTILGLLLALAILVLPAAAIPPENPFVGNSQSPLDIDVTHISQGPRYNFDAAKNNPAAGDRVTFTARIRNRGTSETGSFSYQWYVDGAVVSSGRAQTIAWGRDTMINYTWTWQAGDHDISFFADPANVFSEKSEQNNLRTIRTTGLRVGFWVEQSVYRYFNDHQLAFTQQYGIADEANSWEDWAQRQIDLANRLMGEAVSPSSPNGILDRWRLDQVIVVADGTLPLAGGLATNQPDTRDRTVDLMWGFPQGILSTGSYRTTDNNANPFHQEVSLLHEMLHARYLVDAHAMDIRGHSVGVLTENGTRLFPGGRGVVHVNSDSPSLMNGGTRFSEWEAVALNLWAGKRPAAGWGNTNPHAGLGWYLANRTPAQHTLRVVDSQGNPVESATVQVYRADRVPLGSRDPEILEAAKDFSPVYIDNIVDAEGTTDAHGLYSLGANPFSVAEPIDAGNFNRCVDLVKVRYRGNVTLFWLDLPMVQTRYYRGETAGAVFDVNIAETVGPREEVTISGKVTAEENGAGLSGITVTFSRQDGGHTFSVMTGPFGVFSTQVEKSLEPSCQYNVTANRDTGEVMRPVNPVYGSARLNGIQPDQNRGNVNLALPPAVSGTGAAPPGRIV
ncbi:MAG: hypothetical protein LUQ64_00570 [Methanomicrobiales archaeon]|nr:hypothetical protein [Methanomicrobiales archaeon]